MKIIILDRDGVINYDSINYIRSPDEWHPIPDSLNAIAQLTQAGYRIAVATNQSGIARGYYSEKTLNDIHQKMHDAVLAAGGKIDVVFHCPHHPDEGCHCRKPKPGLLLQVADHFSIDLRGVPFIGDRASDLDAANAVGATGILIKSNLAEVTLPERYQHHTAHENLQTAIQQFL